MNDFRHESNKNSSVSLIDGHIDYDTERSDDVNGAEENHAFSN